MPSETKKINIFLRVLAHLGERSQAFFAMLGGISWLAGDFFRATFRSRFEFRSLVQQFYFIGLKSTTLIFVITFFTGMVLCLQFIVSLQDFNLENYAGTTVGLSLTRELGPVLTALMLAARAGSGMTAELGSMAITEQVMAVEAMGANPTAKLVVPRVIACVFCAPILAVIGDVIGIVGGMLVFTNETGANYMYYVNQIQTDVDVYDFLSGVSKSFFFGFFIGIISCFYGLNTRGGGAGVGKATTQAVVLSSITIFISDFFLTKLFLIIY